VTESTVKKAIPTDTVDIRVTRAIRVGTAAVGIVAVGTVAAPPHRSGVALAMRHRLGGLSTYGLEGHFAGDEHPTYAPLEHGSLLPLGTRRLS